MDLKPVKHYAGPRYPTSAYLVEHPELLRLVPKRWRGNKVVLATLGAAAVLVTSCQSLHVSGKLAPIFVHGEGRGTFGCRATNPPVLLSEDEARAVITAEAAKAGLKFDFRGFEIPRAHIPETDKCSDRMFDDLIRPLKHVQVSRLTLDGFDKARRIGYEYVSKDDVEEWEYKPNYEDCTGWTDDMRTTAQRLRLGLEESPDVPTVGIFYDPGMDMHTAWNVRNLEDSLKGIDPKQDHRSSEPVRYSEELLRAQVRDFIHWLKAQRII